MDNNDKKRLLHDMLFSRRFEERCYEAYVERKIGGFLHLYPGQEACAHGVMSAARPGFDYVITGYRDHIHAILCGADPKAVMAELFARETGAMRPPIDSPAAPGPPRRRSCCGRSAVGSGRRRCKM